MNYQIEQLLRENLQYERGLRKRLQAVLHNSAASVHEAWGAFQNSCAMNEHTGHTGNDKLDECASKLDEASMLLLRWGKTNKPEGT